MLAAGRLETQKGFDLLIAAWEPIAARHPDWQLRIYGAGPRRAELRGLILERGLYESVFLMGRTPDLGAAMAEASLFVLELALRGLRHGARRGDEQGPAGGQLRLPARAGRDRQPWP